MWHCHLHPIVWISVTCSQLDAREADNNTIYSEQPNTQLKIEKFIAREEKLWETANSICQNLQISDSLGLGGLQESKCTYDLVGEGFAVPHPKDLILCPELATVSVLS